MNDELKMKELISRYVDGQVTAEEQRNAEERLQASPSLKAYYEELVRLKKLLRAWPAESPSPDWEQKIQTSLQRTAVQEGQKMKKESPWNIGILAGTIASILIGVNVMQNYAQKASQGRMWDAVTYYSTQLSSAKNTKDYEPYYLRSNYQVLAAKTDRKVSSISDSQTEAEYAPYSHKAEDKILLASKLKGSTFKEAGTLSTSQQVAQATRGAAGFQSSSYARSPALREESIADGLVIIERGYDHEKTRCFSSQDSNCIPLPSGNFHTEEYDRIYENPFLTVKENPLSTFSIDVDTASYSNIRRFLTSNQMPPEDAVRIEEMINYFSYDYPAPERRDPFSITLKGAVCPWQSDHQLVLVGLQGKTLKTEQIPPSNLVFLIDVSGSMDEPNKLPLLQSAFRMMTNQLTKDQKVSLVVYAGSAGQVLDPTSGSNKQKILDAIDRLKAGGSTAGGQGIQLAYQIAKENFIPGGNNRVILATDGDFNVGVSSDGELVRIIEEKRKEGIFLTVLGFGMGNYKDSKMEKLADKGNGNYFYIDTMNEARKVLVQELGSTLFTIAKDVKIQIEFNPAKVKAYRLIGYENRMLAKEDFNDDTKDAGELGAGHTVTALYEIVPTDSSEKFAGVDDLVYQKQQTVSSNDLMTVKLRYKKPEEEESQLLTQTIRTQDVDDELSGDFEFAAAVAEFGLLLRNSEHKGNSSYAHLISHAQESQGKDPFGYRAEFIDLVRKAQQIDHRESSPDNAEGPGIQFKGK